MSKIKDKKVIVSIVVIVIIILGAIGLVVYNKSSNEAPTIMYSDIEYNVGYSVTAQELITESVANVSDDRTDSKDLEVSLYKNDRKLDDDERINTREKGKQTYEIRVTDESGLYQESLLTVNVKE